MASKTWVWMLMVILTGLMGSLEGYEFKVGGKEGWVLNPSESYDQWSHRMRFQVNDTLFFKYKKGTNSVLLVNKQDYDTCNSQNPIMKMDGGDSVFKFDRSGPLYFISGNKDSCGKGQKLTLVVMAVRHNKKTTSPPTLPPTAGSQPPVTQTPATSPTQASPPLSPLPSTVSPTPAKSPATLMSPTPANSPTTMMSPTPAKSPATMMSPTPANSPTTTMSPTPANSPMMSPTPAKSPGTMISPTPANSPTTTMSPTPASSPTTTMSPTPANSPSTTMSPPAMSPATSPAGTTLSPGMTPATSAPADNVPTPGSNTAAPESSPSSVPAFTPPSFTVLMLSVALGSFVAAPREIMGIF